MQMIKFTDTNSDGCGTNIEVYVQIEGKEKLTRDIFEKINIKIMEYKEENIEEWDMNGVIDEVCKYLETEGYICHPVIPEYEIEF